MDAYKKELLIIKIQNVFIFIIKLLTSALPLKNYIIMESHPDLSDNTFAVYEELIKRGYNEKYKIFWFLNKEKPDLKMPKNVYLQRKMTGSLFNKLKAKWISARAKFIIDSNLYIYKVHKNQIRIHLKHGLPMKDATYYNNCIGEVDFVSVPSDYWVDVCAEEHNINSQFIKPLGFARNDVLKAVDHPNKIIIWMPTYRKLRGQQNSFFENIMSIGLPLVKNSEDLDEINTLFKNNQAYLLIRLHPAQDISNINLSDMSNIKLCDEEFLRKHKKSLYSILTYTDALISDYSSIYYDYLNLAKPIALAVEDFEQYKKNNGILAKSCDEFKEMYPAQFLENYDDLLAFLQGVFDEDPEVYKCAEAQKKYMGFNDGNAAKRIVDYMEKEFGL